MNIKVISINEFMSIEFKMCFVCGLKKYHQFYFNKYLYRVCFKCMKKNNVRKFFGIKKNECFLGSDSIKSSDSN